MDKTETRMEMEAGLYNLIMGSNQIVYNRGRALAYLGGADKKRNRPDGGNGPMQQVKRHQYDKKRSLQ